ncbi:unnamed protein product [Paramecium sonneborni]|uniref:Uncharacterized protein n=1 Tax=Paramecium sonneborni TaxID=65129 RepID=A0A8S1LBP2_9CILI|nr:unnamed protein product [Paramecium sonneborni]
MSKTSFGELLQSDQSQESQSESSEFKVDLRKQRGSQTANADAKRYHKIPLKTQILLFQMVFSQGKRIKQVAKSLGMNYSSAKSLIHYYKNAKRPIPTAISSIINLNKTCGFKKLRKGNDNFFVDIQLKKKSIRKYNYHQRLKEEQSKCTK